MRSRLFWEISAFISKMKGFIDSVSCRRFFRLRESHLSSCGIFSWNPALLKEEATYRSLFSPAADNHSVVSRNVSGPRFRWFIFSAWCSSITEGWWWNKHIRRKAFIICRWRCYFVPLPLLYCRLWSVQICLINPLLPVKKERSGGWTCLFFILWRQAVHSQNAFSSQTWIYY